MTKSKKRVAAGKKAKRKGNSFERHVARQLEKWWGYGKFERTPSSGGWSNKGSREEFNACGDIVTTADDFLFTVECKNSENWVLDDLIHSDGNSKLHKWLKQAVEETPDGKIPMLVAKRKFKSPLVFFPERGYAGPPVCYDFSCFKFYYDCDMYWVMSFDDFIELDPGYFRL